MKAEYATDAGCGGLGRLGLIVLSTDETLENEARHVLAGRDVSLMHARIPSQVHVTPETLAMMDAHLPASAAQLPQALDVVGYACTSGATVIGPARVAEQVRTAHPGVPVTDPLSAVIAALRALGARRIGLVTPYLASVTAPMRGRLEAAGIAVADTISFEQSEDRTVARITEASALEAMRAVGAGGCDAVFASCTNLRTFGVIAAAEAELGVPVVSSNQALLWHMLGLAGVDAAGWGPGRLFAEFRAAA